jgi:DNA replication protein DnaC
MPEFTLLSEFPRPHLVRTDIPGYACRACDDTGFVPIEQDGRHCVKRCECWHRKQRLYAEDVPKEFQAADLATYRVMPGNAAALEGAREFLAESEGDLYIAGHIGSGKTRLAASLLNEWHRAHYSGLFVHVPLMLDQLQPHGDGDEQSALEHRLMLSPLLVLDDVGAERDRATDYTRRTLLLIYEARGAKGLRTIWTSNKALGELGEFMDGQGDSRLASRIVGRATAVWIDCEDQRLAKGARP